MPSPSPARTRQKNNEMRRHAHTPKFEAAIIWVLFCRYKSVSSRCDRLVKLFQFVIKLLNSRLVISNNLSNYGKHFLLLRIAVLWVVTPSLAGGYQCF